MDGTLFPTRDQEVAEQSKNDRDSTNHQVVIDADTRLVVVVGQPLPGNRNDCKAWSEFGAKAAVGHITTIADGGYPGTGLVMPHRRRVGEELTEWKQEHNRSPPVQQRITAAQLLRQAPAPWPARPRPDR